MTDSDKRRMALTLSSQEMTKYSTVKSVSCCSIKAQLNLHNITGHFHSLLTNLQMSMSYDYRMT